MVHLTGTYSNVDGSADPVGAAEWMDTMCDWPFIRVYKERTVDLLHIKPGARLLDVGCGTGHDTRALATAAGSDGVAIGIDASAVMLKTARTRGGAYLQADARALPYADDAFDGTRIDRALQHVAGPDDAVEELVRVTRSGGGSSPSIPTRRRWSPTFPTPICCARSRTSGVIATSATVPSAGSCRACSARRDWPTWSARRRRSSSPTRVMRSASRSGPGSCTPRGCSPTTNSPGGKAPSTPPSVGTSSCMPVPASSPAARNPEATPQRLTLPRGETGGWRRVGRRAAPDR